MLPRLLGRQFGCGFEGRLLLVHGTAMTTCTSKHGAVVQKSLMPEFLTTSRFSAQDALARRTERRRIFQPILAQFDTYLKPGAGSERN